MQVTISRNTLRNMIHDKEYQDAIYHKFLVFYISEK